MADKPHTEIVDSDLPLHCPLPATPLWNQHPRVFLDIQKTGHVSCPYCGTHYVLAENTKSKQH